MTYILDDRQMQVSMAGANERTIDCNKASLAGSVSQRACVFWDQGWCFIPLQMPCI